MTIALKLLGLAKSIGGFLLKNWMPVLLIGLAAGVLYYRDESAERLAERDAARKDAATATANAKAWHEAHDLQVKLATETALARAAEQATIITIRDAAGTAKEEIAHAPGADDPYRYSGAAYCFMRPQSAGCDGAPATPPAGVGSR